MSLILLHLIHEKSNSTPVDTEPYHGFHLLAIDQSLWS